jgi:hypothetical protein
MQVLCISLRIVLRTRRAQYVKLAALHLSDPLMMVQRLYGHPDPLLTWEADSGKIFGAETEEERLRVGPISSPNDSGEGLCFGVTKGQVTAG